MKSLLVSGSALLASLVPSLALAQVTIFVGIGNTCTNAICNIASTILYVINYVLVPLLFAIAFIVFLWGIAQAYIFSKGDPEKVSQGHKLLLWGIIGFVVMISLWGLVNVVAGTFGLQGAVAPRTPTSF